MERQEKEEWRGKGGEVDSAHPLQELLRALMFFPLPVGLYSTAERRHFDGQTWCSSVCVRSPPDKPLRS